MSDEISRYSGDEIVKQQLAQEKPHVDFQEQTLQAIKAKMKAKAIEDSANPEECHLTKELKEIYLTRLEGKLVQK
jgi:hypothetical protein